LWSQGSRGAEAPVAAVRGLSSWGSWAAEHRLDSGGNGLGSSHQGSPRQVFFSQEFQEVYLD